MEEPPKGKKIPAKHFTKHTAESLELGGGLPVAAVPPAVREQGGNGRVWERTSQKRIKW